MKDSHYRVSLDIHSTQSQVSLPVKQGDTSRKVFISLCEGGKPYHIDEDCYAVFSARKPDGTLIENYCIIAGNVIEYTFTEQTTAVGGMLNCEIKLYGGDSGLITSPRFTIIVDTRVVSDAEVESYSEYLALTNLYTITNSAAANANGKAELANAAAENANAKAALANTAASNADAVAEETEAIKTEVETKLANGEFKGEKGDKGNPGKDADYNLVANALKGYASGNPIRLDDVSPVEHTVRCKARGKNLVAYPFPETTLTRYGITYTDNGDGSITANGTATANSHFIFKGKSSLPVGKYAFSGCPTGGSASTYYMTVNGFYGIKSDIGSGGSLEVKNDSPQTNFVIIVMAGTTVSNLVFKPQLELGTTATEYEPYLDPSTATLTRYGLSETDNPKTYTPNSDGTVDGVTSLYPTTVLTTDTEGVTIDVEYNRDANKVIAELLELIIGKTFVTDVKLYASKWVGTVSPYSQVVTVEGATSRSQVDLTPSHDQLAVFHSKDLAFVTENDNGKITVYAIGQKPTNDYTIQATVTEVKA